MLPAEAGLKTLVWHWPGSSWPPSTNSDLLSVVDGTQPGSVNMGVAQMDWEKIIVATPDIESVKYAPRVEKAAQDSRVPCVIENLTTDDMIAGDDDDANDGLTVGMTNAREVLLEITY